MALKDDESAKYEGRGDFGPYNEPSWVPEGKCKACAIVVDEISKAPRRRTPEELRSMKIVGHTLNKTLAVRHCPVCDTPAV